MLRKLLIITAGLSLGVLALGYTGRVFPLGESLAAFRLPNILAAAVFLLALRKYRVFYVGLALITLSVLSVASVYIPQKVTGDPVYRLYQKNLLARNQDISDLRADIVGPHKIDFITLQEVFGTNGKLLTQLADEFPHQILCSLPGYTGLAILSRWPIIEGQTYCQHDGMTAMKVQTSAGPVWLISIHQKRPYPYEQATHSKHLLGRIEALEGPKLIGGDFNAVPWSYTLRAFEKISGTHQARPAINSFTLPYIPMTIPIDHVLVPKNSRARAQRRGKKGSDHFGIIAEFTLPK